MTWCLLGALAGIGLGADGGMGQVVDGGETAADAGAPFVEQVSTDRLFGGRHWRLVTADGVIHVWRPAGFAPRSAGTVLYVHGYYTDVDGAWAEHRLARQFSDSRLNALFIAPEAPNGGEQDVQFKDLNTLLEAVARLTKHENPKGHVVVMGHSGAWRTLVNWLSDQRLETVIMLDAMYANETEFDAWIAGNPGKRFVNVTYDTINHCEAFCQRFTFTRRNDIPKRASEFTRQERAAQLLYLQSQYDHMELVTTGKAIPVLLQLSSLPRL